MRGGEKLHSDFPRVVKMVVEQPRDARFRLRYDPGNDTFVATDVPSMLFERRFPGVYGWIEGLGQPPTSHCDILLLTDLHFPPGAVVDAYVCGVFFRSDRDHKILAVDAAYSRALPLCDISFLPERLALAVREVYPVLEPGERWGDASEAASLLEAMRSRTFIPNAD